MASAEIRKLLNKRLGAVITSWVDVAGWTLVHFVWQGAGIALLAALGLRLLRSRRPQAAARWRRCWPLPSSPLS